MTDEIAPCPFCEDGGKPFPYIDRQTKMGYAVKCFVCHAQGPIVLFETDHRRTWEEVTAPAIAEAKAHWNKLKEVQVPEDAVVLVDSTEFDHDAAEKAAKRTREIVGEVIEEYHQEQKSHSG